MPSTVITLKTNINATIESTFNLSRDITFHKESASHTKEEAIEGITDGLINLDETVTWRGKHFGLYLKHTSKICKMNRPFGFTDIMIKGHFTYFIHEHIFNKTDFGVEMIDILKYKAPYGIFGKLFDRFFLKRHMSTFLSKRNSALKSTLESLN